MWASVMKRWHADCGYADVLKLALPLILSTGAWSIQQFIDRMFLSWYSPEAIAASVPAGMLNYTFLIIFLGIGGYLATFIAQHFGAKQYKMVGKVVWQGVYLSIMAAFIVTSIVLFSESIFEIMGHEPAVQAQEIIYFDILCYGSIFAVLSSVFSSFFNGLGKTGIVLIANLIACALNVVLDYILIFGVFGLPAMGIAGAGWGTVISAIALIFIYLFFMMKKEHRKKFGLLSGWRIDFNLIKRVLSFGTPNGIQGFIEIFGFTIFMIIIGRFGLFQAAAANIVINIFTLGLLPLIGCSIAVSILVGQNLGQGKPEHAEYGAWSAMHIMLLYMGVLSCTYLFLPETFLIPFGLNQADSNSFAKISEIAVILIRFMAPYSMLCVVFNILSGAIKGAGDTKFAMGIMFFTSTFFQIIPVYLIIEVFGGGLIAAWGSLNGFALACSILFLLRFRMGKWKSMLIIDKAA